MKTIEFHLPPTWKPEWLCETNLPHCSLIGDIPHRNHYCFRGIPLKLSMAKDQSLGLYLLYLSYWHPYQSVWIEAGDVYSDDEHITIGCAIEEKLNPIFDIILGKNVKLKH